MNLKPGWMRCPDCSGHGPYDGEAGDKCKTCDGSGTIKLSHAAPESETPEVDAVVHNGFSLARVARSLEHRLFLAQAEIKGHMRVIDDLKADLADEAPARFQLQAALERAQTKWQQAQSRIAELEKVVKFLLGEEALLGFWFGERPEGQPQFWWRKHLREALKDRA